jgi:hypothetical protein
MFYCSAWLWDDGKEEEAKDVISFVVLQFQHSFPRATKLCGGASERGTAKLHVFPLVEPLLKNTVVFLNKMSHNENIFEEHNRYPVFTSIPDTMGDLLKLRVLINN